MNTGNTTIDALARVLDDQRRALGEATDHARCLRSQLTALTLHQEDPAEHADAGGLADVEEVRDAERGRALLASVAATATEEIRVIQPSAVARHLVADWLGGDRYGRERDVTVRTIHQSSMLQSDRAVAYLDKLERRGVDVRIAPLLPFRMIMVDQQFALVCPLDRMLVLRGPALLQLLGRVFEFCWTDARPLRSAHSVERPAAPTPAPNLSEQQLVILRLWAKGHQDAAIAKELQISPRTLRRSVSALLRRLGVSSRFEAGMVAARGAWLHPQQGPAASA